LLEPDFGLSRQLADVIGELLRAHVTKLVGESGQLCGLRRHCLRPAETLRSIPTLHNEHYGRTGIHPERLDVNPSSSKPDTSLGNVRNSAWRQTTGLAEAAEAVTSPPFLVFCSAASGISGSWSSDVPRSWAPSLTHENVTVT
jgi:hypothetical protein